MTKGWNVQNGFVVEGEFGELGGGGQRKIDNDGGQAFERMGGYMSVWSEHEPLLRKEM